MHAPQSREELLALPIAKIESESEFQLVPIKVEGAVCAACDDEGRWWGISPTFGGWARYELPCAPVSGI